ncbi:MAG TPA: PD-(D/E)XK nuclease family protein, partial [Myxococcota bacterium]|nr:PD-(D/E)XK nuclease family protein [Myxococcota bacterium]
ISRDRRLRDCARKYYLYHYASLGGRRAEPQSLTREIYVLKHLRNRFMWVGEVVHELIELALHAWQRGQEVPLGSLVARGTRRMRADYLASLQGVYRDRPAQTCGLVEHEYGESVSREEWQAMRDRMERCVRNFFALPLAQTIRATPSWRWLAVEAMGSFDLDGATIIVKPDFAYRDADGRVILVDWKTGVPYGNEHTQLAVYGMFAERAWGLGSERMQAQLVYLADGGQDIFEVSPEELTEAEAAVRASVRLMRDLSASVLDGEGMHHFPQTEVEGACGRCSFRRVCRRD